jgi:hypothetical protein
MPPSPESGPTGALVLVLLVAAAFCGWYIFVRELPSDSSPPAIVEAPPILPPTITDTSADLPGHEHYTLSVSKNLPTTSKTPQTETKPPAP